MTASAATIAAIAREVGAWRLRRLFSMAVTLPSRVDGRAMDKAGTPTRAEACRQAFAISTTWDAYSAAGSPVQSTASSHARSASCRRRAERIQSSGLNQNRIRRISALTWIGQSSRAMCASSWQSATCTRSSLQVSACTGRSTRGLSTPHVARMSGSGVVKSTIGRSMP